MLEPADTRSLVLSHSKRQPIEKAAGWAAVADSATRIMRLEARRTKDKVTWPVGNRPDGVIDCLRVSVTDRCDLRCTYCMPPDGSRRLETGGWRSEAAGRIRQMDQPSSFLVPHSSFHPVLRFEEIVEVIRLIRERFGLRTVRLTGGEPLVRRDVVGLVQMLARLGLEDFAMTTNGQRLADLARPLREAGLRRVNISLDSLDAERYARMTRGGRLERTLAGIEAARTAGFQSIKLNTVVLRGENDREVCDLVRFAMARGFDIRFLELMAIGVAAETHARRFVASAEVRERLSAELGLSAVDRSAGERVHTFHVEDRNGRSTNVGFISPETEPFCTGCRRLRLTADGRLLGCLMHSNGPDLRLPLRRPAGPDLDAIEQSVERTLRAKPLLRESSSPRLMAGIGG